VRTRTVVAIWTLALAAAGAAIALVLTSDHEPDKLATILLAAPAGLAFVAAGLIAQVRRPENRTGTLLLLVGFSWFLGAMGQSNHSFVFTLGVMCNFVFLAFVFHLLLAFPSGRLETRIERLVTISMYGLVALYAASVPFFTFDDACGAAPCPDNAVFIWTHSTVTKAIEIFVIGSALLLIATAIALLIRRWRRATAPLRRALTPVFVTGGALIGLLAFFAVLGVAFSEETVESLNALFYLSLLAVPLSFLFGLLRTRLAGSAVGRLVVELEETAPGPGELEGVLRKALGDPSLRVAYWTSEPNGFFDSAGRAIELPGTDEEQAATTIERDGKPVAALIHDRSLDPGLTEAVVAAAALALETEVSLRALRTSEDRNSALLDEIRRSRSRLVEAGDAERRRLERNLHDGAQQRLVTLSLTLRLAQSKVGSDPRAVSELLSSASIELALALEELRELARGIHPAVLTDRGLGPALESLADLAPLPVELASLPDRRLPAVVETAAFYVVSESLANVAKYAQASTARVSVVRANGLAVVEVADDGVGGARARNGSGLRGLVDRVESLDGRLEIHSEPGQGTRIRAEIPCA
jgi:signal transduction histidine kinase